LEKGREKNAKKQLPRLRRRRYNAPARDGENSRDVNSV
jgi:hypothetical protein